jgi:sterol desaturase/sphingolipid hydroxylase (fatty acid hydroxylase superfamily)
MIIYLLGVVIAFLLLIVFGSILGNSKQININLYCLCCVFSWLVVGLIVFICIAILVWYCFRKINIKNPLYQETHKVKKEPWEY